jgi:FADH2 O2-dependent halogenase
MPNQKTVYDFLIAGGGFAGSISALCLNSTGFNVCLVEKGEHPKFSIGESSTPIADMILRDLSDEYNLPELRKLSRYGSWQTNYPTVNCGLKRGFSYYKHQKNAPFSSYSNHSRELLVAASIDDENSDTQWYRPDTDHLFVQMVKDAGIDYLDHTEIETIKRTEAGHWLVKAFQNSTAIEISTGFIIDATGSPQFSGQFFGTTSATQSFQTNTRALYSHFENVSEWQTYLDNHGFKTDDYPYNPDHSALHHLLEPGWLWMLRFNDGLLSAGLVLDGEQTNDISASEEWRNIISKYPSIHTLFSDSNLAEEPGKIVRTGRLQRKLDNMYGDSWAALHHTAGFIDPLHSTGIAHSLAGVEKLVSLLISTFENDGERQVRLGAYQTAFFNELALIDLLVAGCNKSRHHFDLFSAYSMLYFTCTIQYEQSRLAGKIPDHFLSADKPDITSIVQNCYNRLSELLKGNRSPTQGEINAFVRLVSEEIEPFNSVGLMDPSKKNMYEHTAVNI